MPETRPPGLLTTVSPDKQCVVTLSSQGDLQIGDIRTILDGRPQFWVNTPKSWKSWITNVKLLRCSQRFSGGVDGSETLNHTIYVLFSDGRQRLIAAAIHFDQPLNLRTKNIDPNTIAQAELLVDYDLGTQNGSITLVEYFDDLRALVLQETGVYANLISLTSAQADQIQAPKFGDARSIARSPDGCYLAILSRISGQDAVSVHSSTGDRPPSHFVIVSFDAVSITWAPNDDPVLALVGAPAHGTSVVFYTATGQALRSLDLASLTPQKSLGGGIRSLQWLKLGRITLLCATDYDENVLVRTQDNRNFSLKPLFRTRHPDVIDGTRGVAFQEIRDSPGQYRFTPLTNVLGSSQDVDTQSEIEILGVNVDASFLATRTSSHPKALCLWSRDSGNARVLIFRERLRQVLFHPKLPRMLVAIPKLSIQSAPAASFPVYVWSDIDAVPHVVTVRPPNLPLSRGTAVEGQWLPGYYSVLPGPRSDDGPDAPFLLTWPGGFEIGCFKLDEGDGVRFESLMRDDSAMDTMHMLNIDRDDDSILFDTPSKPPIKREPPA